MTTIPSADETRSAMAMLDRVNADIVQAIRARDRARLGPLRLLKAALVNRRIEQSHDLNEAEAQRVASSLARQRRDAIEQFARAGRVDLAEAERAELAVLSAYVPPPMDAAELHTLVDAAIAEVGAVSPKDMGRVMKVVMPRLSARGVDGAAVSQLVRQKLGA